MATQDTNKLVETVVDTQKKVLDTVVESTRKFTNGNNLLNETLEKGSEWYKNWLDGQKNLFQKTTDTAQAATDTAKESSSRINEYYDKWMSSQMSFAKQMWENNQEWVKTTTNNTSPNPYINWQNSWNGMTNQLNGWMSNMNPSNWNNMMPQMNPFNMDSMKTATNSWTGVMNQYYGLMNNAMGDWQKNFSNGSAQDAYKNMVNIGEGFTRFTEIWMPMFKSIQDKTFNIDVYRQMMKPDLYKDMMDKYFGFMPENNRNYIQNMMSMMTDASKQFGTTGVNNYNYFRDVTGKMGLDPHQVFGNMNVAYNSWHNMMNEAVAPFTRMVTPTQHTKTAQEWMDIANRISLYNIKNAELQYMIYNHGVKVMDELAENISKKVQNGEQVNSVVSLYQEWLNISDKSYVALFESETYSQLMAEVGAMQMKLRRDIELQTEKAMSNLPVATRSDMDELYKAIYDLKSQVRQLQSMMDIETEAQEASKSNAGGATNGKAAKAAKA